MANWKYNKKTDSYGLDIKDTSLVLTRNPITLIAVYRKNKMTFTEVARYDEGRITKLCEGSKHTKENDLEMVCLGTEVKKLKTLKDKFLRNNSLRKKERTQVRTITACL